VGQVEGRRSRERWPGVHLGDVGFEPGKEGGG